MKEKMPNQIMDCEQFRRAYHRFDGAKNVVHWKDVETPNYRAYLDHMDVCPECRDWFQTEQLIVHQVDVSQYPCVHIAYQTNWRCPNHPNPWECPSVILIHVEAFNEYGIPFRDGTGMYVKIDACPWCGKVLPDSLREEWCRTLANKGYDPYSDQAPIPPEFESAAWYRRPRA